MFLVVLLWSYSFYRMWRVWAHTLNFSGVSPRPSGWDVILTWLNNRKTRDRELEGRDRELEGRDRELEGRDRELEGTDRGEGKGCEGGSLALLSVRVLTESVGEVILGGPGVWLQEQQGQLGPITGAGLQLAGPITGPCLQQAGPITGVCSEPAGPITGPCTQLAGPITWHGSHLAGPITGPCLQLGGPITMPGLQLDYSQTELIGPGLRAASDACTPTSDHIRYVETSSCSLLINGLLNCQDSYICPGNGLARSSDRLSNSLSIYTNSPKSTDI